MENDMNEKIKEDMVDILLKEAVDNNSIILVRLYKDIEIINQKIADIKTKSTEYILEYQKRCPHPSSKKRQVSYMAGGYDHTSQANYEVRCTRCEKLLESKIERGTYA